MDINAAFPSPYLKAADLQGRQLRVIMDRVEMQDIGGDHKPVLFFQGKDKGIVLNKTNSNNIGAAYGYDTDNWLGKEVILFSAMVDFQGRTVPAIRVRTPTMAEQKMKRTAPAKPPVQQVTEEDLATLDDEIPF